MKACPGLIRPPYTSHTHRLPRSMTKSLGAPKLVRQREMLRKQNSPSRFSVNLPSVPASPNPSVASPDPVLSVCTGTNPHELPSCHVQSTHTEGITIKAESVVSYRDVTSTGSSSPQITYKDLIKKEPKDETVAPMAKSTGTTSTPVTPVTPVTPLTPMTPMTPDSLSDLSRPASSQFSFSTNLNSSLSNASSVNANDDSDGDHQNSEEGVDISNDDLEACSSSLSDLRFSSLDRAVFASCSTPKSTQSFSSKSLNSPKPQNTSHPKTLNESLDIQLDDPLESKSPHSNQITNPSPCPSYLNSQSSPASASPLDVRSDLKTCRWPVLPPITPQRGSHGSRASLSSPTGGSQSRMFAELDSAARWSVSGQSLDHADCSDTEIFSPTTELSPGLAALTVGCDSGELGSLSRVQLLLLDRGVSDGLDPPPDPEWNSPIEEREDYEPELHVWSVGIPQHYQCTDPGVQMSSSMPLSVTHFPIGQVDIESGTPGLSAAEDVSRSSSWSLRCDSRENSTCEDQVTAPFRGSDVIGETRLRLSSQPIVDFLAKYCIISPEKLAAYTRAFEAVDSDGDGFLSCFQVLLALKEIIPPELLTEEEEIYVYRILELVDFSVTEGLTDLRLFAVVASLAQKIATLDDFMRSLISNLDFKSLEMKLYKAKQLFLFLLDGQSESSEAPPGRISAQQLLVELKAGGIREEHEDEVRRELRSLRSLDLLDFLAHLPLFILIHNSVISNPLDDSSNL